MFKRLPAFAMLLLTLSCVSAGRSAFNDREAAIVQVARRVLQNPIFKDAGQVPVCLALNSTHLRLIPFSRLFARQTAESPNVEAI